jgi:hypothetical protein
MRTITPVFACFLWMLLFSLAACQRKTLPPPLKTGESQPITNITPDTLSIPTLPEAPLDIRASLSKTACFGKCPVFQVTLLANGKVKWYGEKNVDRLGAFEAVISQEDWAKLLTEAKEKGIFKLEPKYPANGQHLADIPLTELFLHDGRHKKKIVNQADAPQSLMKFEKYFLEMMDRLDWHPL